jgi:predicted O-methyltransferase YrrM
VIDHTWEDDYHLTVGDHSFVLSPTSAPSDELTLFKTPDLVRQYLTTVEREQPRRIVEVGVDQGGSTALLAVLAQPERLLAIDLEAEAPRPLVRFIDENGLADVVLTRFGVDQADRSRVAQLLDEAFGSEPIDLVFDDASHQLGPTRATFETIFPRLRPGGLFVIEDWSWEHVAAARMARQVPVSSPEFSESLARLRALVTTVADERNPDRDAAQRWASEVTLDHINDADLDLRPGDDRAVTYDAMLAVSFDVLAKGERDEREPWTSATPVGPAIERPLTDLVLQLVLVRAASDQVVSEIHIEGGMVGVRRGPAVLDPVTFRLDDVHHDYFGWTGEPG